MAEKKEIRKQMISDRDGLLMDAWNTKSGVIERNILRSKLYKDCDALMVYADFHGEVGTTILIEDALLKGKKVFLPKAIENFDEAKMEFYQITSTFELVSGYKGIKEPMGNSQRAFNYEKFAGKKILMLVPGVAFDKNGYRLGYGKGYYDNYLSDKPDIVKCGICFTMQLTDDLPVNEHDVKMDHIITEDTPFSEINKYYY